MDNRSVALGVLAICSAASFITWVVASAAVRMRGMQTPLESSDIEARLARIESAVEAIAIEVERNGELQRFNARLAQGGTAPEPLRIPRPITPH